MLNILAKEKETDDPKSRESLSRTEEAHLMRALDHFELYCKLLGISHYKFDHQRRFRFRNMAVLRKFLCMYDFGRLGILFASILLLRRCLARFLMLSARIYSSKFPALIPTVSFLFLFLSLSFTIVHICITHFFNIFFGYKQ